MKKILIVDDQPNIRKLIRFALQDRFSLKEAGDADAAYELLIAERPSGIVLDVNMPGAMNGFQLCQRIRRETPLAGIHIVLVTANTQVADQELGRALGADAYFIKPFSPLALARHLIGVLLAAEDRAA